MLLKKLPNTHYLRLFFNSGHPALKTPFYSLILYSKDRVYLLG